MKVCVDCGSKEVYEIEFRMDYSYARKLNAVNDGIADIENDDLPSYLDGYYCNRCRGFCSVKEASE
jgi:hypothetical protein